MALYHDVIPCIANKVVHFDNEGVIYSAEAAVTNLVNLVATFPRIGFTTRKHMRWLAPPWYYFRHLIEINDDDFERPPYIYTEPNCRSVLSQTRHSGKLPN